MKGLGVPAPLPGFDHPAPRFPGYRDYAPDPAAWIAREQTGEFAGALA